MGVVAKMSERLHKLVPELNRLRRMKTKDRKWFIKTCSRDVIDSISECCANILKGNVRLTPAQYKKLRKYKRALRKMSDRKVSSENRRKTLQAGGFLGFLLPPLIGLASSLVGRLINRGRD